MYQLMRKSGKYKWNPCVIKDDNGKLIKGGRTSDKEIIKSNKEKIESLYPEEVYAILEL